MNAMPELLAAPVGLACRSSAASPALVVSHGPADALGPIPETTAPKEAARIASGVPAEGKETVTTMTDHKPRDNDRRVPDRRGCETGSSPAGGAPGSRNRR